MSCGKGFRMAYEEVHSMYWRMVDRCHPPQLEVSLAANDWAQGSSVAYGFLWSLVSCGSWCLRSTLLLLLLLLPDRRRGLRSLPRTWLSWACHSGRGSPVPSNPASPLSPNAQQSHCASEKVPRSSSSPKLSTSCGVGPQSSYCA